MGADEFCCGRMVEKFADDGFFEFSHRLQGKGSNKGNSPILKNPYFFKAVSFETTTDILLRNGYDYFIHTLIGEFIKSHKHHSAAFARCRWCLDEQVLTMALGINHSLHFAHTEFVSIARFARLKGILYFDEIGHDYLKASYIVNFGLQGGNKSSGIEFQD